MIEAQPPARFAIAPGQRPPGHGRWVFAAQERYVAIEKLGHYETIASANRPARPVAAAS
jgi:hypothetical protein